MPLLHVLRTAESHLATVKKPVPETGSQSYHDCLAPFWQIPLRATPLTVWHCTTGSPLPSAPLQCGSLLKDTTVHCPRDTHFLAYIAHSRHPFLGTYGTWPTLSSWHIWHIANTHFAYLAHSQHSLVGTNGMSPTLTSWHTWHVAKHCGSVLKDTTACCPLQCGSALKDTTAHYAPAMWPCTANCKLQTCLTFGV